MQEWKSGEWILCEEWKSVYCVRVEEWILCEEWKSGYCVKSGRVDYVQSGLTQTRRHIGEASRRRCAAVAVQYLLQGIVNMK